MKSLTETGKQNERAASPKEMLENRFLLMYNTKDLMTQIVIGHFRVPETLTFNMRPSAKPFW